MGILNGLAADAYGAGVAIGAGLADGMRSQIGNVASAAQDLANAVNENLPHSDAKRGPLQHLSDSGRSVPRTLASGMLEGLGRLAAAARTVAGAAASFGTPPLLSSAGAQPGGSSVSYGPVNVTVHATVANDVDINRLAYQIAEITKWRRR